MLDEEAEEGEIDTGDELEDYVEPYQSLERPSAAVPSSSSYNQNQLLDHSDSEETSESNDDSDSEDERPAKRQRRNVIVSKHPPKSAPSKHSLWSSILLEEHIESELKDIGVGQGFKDKSRNVESYNYGLALASKLEEDLDEESEKHIRKKLLALDKKDGSESFNVQEEESPKNFEETLQETQKLLNSRKRKMNQRENSTGLKKPSVKERLQLRVESLTVSNDSSEVEIAQDIALKLHEEKMDLILRVVQLLGKDVALNLFQETQEVENDGGILTADGTRRRTPGGVFLYLLRNNEDLPMEKIREVFAEENKNREKFKRTIRAKRRQAKAESLKQAIAKDLPALPTRGEAMMMRQREEQNPFEDEGVVDINFELE